MSAQSIDIEGRKRMVLFICTHNSARSQMAEALLSSKYGDKYKAYSGGTEPGTLNPLAVQVLKEIGIDISKNRVKSVDEFIRPDLHFDYVVTVCDLARQTCPYFPAPRHLHPDFPDPARFQGTEEEKLGQMRRLRDELLRWIDRTFGSESG